MGGWAQPYTKEMRLYNKRPEPKRGNKTKFSAKTRKIIIARDEESCVRCKRPYSQIHHITFASAGGAGKANNGVCVCVACHAWAHAGNVGREWFEQYRQKYLVEDEK